MAPRVAAVAAAGLLVALGVILGASVQDEEVLSTDPDSGETGAVAGYLLVLTALPAAVGVTLAFGLVARVAWRARLLAAAAAGAASYLLIQLVQAGFPGAIRIEDHVVMSMALFVNNNVGGVGVMGWVLVGVWLLIGALVLTARRMLAPATASDHAASHSAWTLAAVPLLAAGAWGPMEVLLALPAGSRHAAGHSIALAIEFAALVGLLATHVVADRAVVRTAAEPRLVDWGSDTARLATRIQFVLLGTLGAAALGGALLQSLDLDVLFAGLTLGTNLRSHHLLLPVLALPLVPALRHRARALASIAAGTGQAGPPSRGMPRVATWVPAVVAFALAGVLAWSTDGALTPWAAAAVAPLFSVWPFAHRAATTQALWTAYVLWALGNTITASYQHGQDITIRFDTSLGINALWQLLALVIAGVALAQAGLAAAREPRPTLRVTLAMAFAALLGLAAWLEFPLAAWQVNTLTGEGVAIGSLAASQDASVRNIMHGLATVAIVAASVLAARLHRPEWFARARGPTPDASPRPDPAPAGRQRARAAGAQRQPAPRT